MNNATKSRLFSFLALSLALAGLACGSAEQPAEQATSNEAAPEAAPLGASEPAPLPELRTNDAGAVLVSQDEILRMIDAGTAPMILDVRTAEEFAEGHVPGAINISHDELADRLAEVEAAKETGLIVYCRSGRRAGVAEELLLGQGFANVQHLEGDMLAWLEANRPTEKQE